MAVATNVGKHRAGAGPGSEDSIGVHSVIRNRIAHGRGNTEGVATRVMRERSVSGNIPASTGGRGYKNSVVVALVLRLK